MKRIFSLAAALFVATMSWAEINPKPFVIPELTSWQGAEGSFVPSGRVVVTTKELQAVAEAFVADYRTMFGKDLTIVQLKSKKDKLLAGDIVFTLTPDNGETKLGEEGYTLAVGETAEVKAATTKGAYWATRTILQISEQSGSHTLPCGVTTDVPSYSLRGFMMDCGRKYIPLDYLDKLVKVMSYYKMNTLQVHLNDNGFKQYFGNDWDKTYSAFRLESELFPGLEAKDGFYTKKDFVRFQKDAESLFVDIIPEIDVPAHSLAFSHYRKSLGSEEYGMDHLDLKNPEVVPFLDSLFTEYCGGKDPVFRGKRVHIGTDEYSNRDPEVVELFRGLTDHLIKHVESMGKQAVGWGALTHANGKTPVKSDDVILHIWYNGYADPIKMKEDGFQLISIPDGYVYIVPAAGYYYDYLNCEWLYDNWTPAQIGNVKFDERDPQLLGGMFAVWNDHCGNGITVKDIHHRVMPAMQTLSTLCWSADLKETAWGDFNYLSKFLSEAPGVNELGRIAPNSARSTFKYPSPRVSPNTCLDWVGDEVGYDYSVTFTIKADEVNKGDVLFDGPNSRFYLASAENGKLAFEREGYLNEFDYDVPKGRPVTLTIKGTNRETTLLVNGKFRQTLYPLTIGSATTNAGAAGASSDPYSAAKMYYQRTLVFPLQKTGNFKGTISNLSVSNFVE